MSLIHQLGLTFIKGIGATLSKNILNYFGTAEDAFTAPKQHLKKVPGVGMRAENLDLQAALERARQEAEFVEKNGIEVIFYTDSRYPKRLKNCSDAPVLLYSKGNADFNNQKVISIVGTRNATDYGRTLCKQLIEDLKPYNALIVSGLALGIDVAAHKESLRLDLPTVGVLGHGLDRLYPAQNRSVADKMILNGGMLTEFPSGTKPDRENFPQRNRIVAGMADATVVIEAGIKGGALITAEIANSYNRDVYAFPGRINDEYSEGCNFLIRNNKAALLTCAPDLAYALGWDKLGTVQKPKRQMVLPMGLSADEMRIFELLQHHDAPLAIDDLTIKANIPLSQLTMTLLNMELQGYIRSLPGKTYILG
jgi:DNA processing protein